MGARGGRRLGGGGGRCGVGRGLLCCGFWLRRGLRFGGAVLA